MTVNRARSALPPSIVLALAALAACATSEETPGALGTAPATPDSTSTAADETAEPSVSEPALAAEVLIDGARFEPAELTVPAGTEVAFVNRDTYSHTVTEGTEGQAVADAIVNEEVAAHATIRVVFEEAGTFEITCIIHPTMQMTITVED